MKKRILSLGVAVVVSLSVVLTGCGGDSSKNGSAATSTTTQASESTATVQQSDKPDISEEVKLVGYVPGDEQKDGPKVMEEINKLLKKDINATVEMKYVGWGEFFQKYPLILASGEEFDFAFIANWADFAGQAQKGAFMDITDILPKSAPEIFKIADKDAWKATTVKGKIYGVPTDGAAAYNNNGIMYRQDLVEKYKLPAINKMEDFEALMDAVIKNEKGIKPVTLNAVDNNYLFANALFEKTGVTTQGFQVTSGTLAYAGFGYLIDDTSAKLVSLTNTQEYKDTAVLMNKWYKKGFWTTSDMVNKEFVTDTANSKFGLGKTAMEKGNTGNYFNIIEAFKKSHPDWKVGFYYPKSPSGNIAKTDALQNGIAVSPTSKNPERTLMFADKILTDLNYQMLITFGVKDVNYTLDSTGYPVLPEGVSADKATYTHFSNAFSWFLYNYEKNMPQKVNEARNTESKLKEIALAPALIGFTLDTSNIKTQIATVNDVLKQYEIPLNFGLKDTIDKDIQKLTEMLKNSGQDQIMQEAQKQIDQFIKDNAK